MEFEALARAISGEWRGTKHLYMSPPPEAPLSCPSKLSATLIAGGNFLQLNYTWTYEGAAQSGVLLFSYDEEKAASAAWVDSFHASSKIMFCTGTAAEAGIDVSGSYAAPPGPDWGWRIAIRSVSPGELQIVMHNISPEGQEDLAVQLDYVRSSEGH